MLKYITLIAFSVFFVASCSSAKQSQIKSDLNRAESQFVQDSKSIGNKAVNTAKGIGPSIKRAASSASKEMSEMGQEIKNDLY